MTADPYRYFRIEARELADQLGDGVRGLGRGVADRDEVARLLRLAHTLKGAARVVRQLDIAGAAHSIEDVLAPYRGSADPVPADAVARVAGLVDGVSDAVTVL
ncbi:MAG TPA: Hpt domain-containing protein, partial [Micromonosporaceae bacterium]|nr:Hpt domain-containing protein [Micromonosporaceae bacterium]